MGQEMNYSRKAGWWRETPWRMVQTNLREIDMEDMDAEAFAKELADFGATVVNLNAAGIIASYETALPFQNKSGFLHGDSLKDVVDACHRRGIRVIARCDFSKIGCNVYEQHPDWAYRDADGQVMNYNGFVQTCVNGAYQQHYVFEILRELFTTHDFDGLYCNMASPFVTDYDYKVYGPCHCENCRRLYEEQFHEEIPAANDPRNPAFLKYMGWITRCSGQQKKKLYAEVKAIREDIAINGLDFQRSECNQDVGRPTWLYQASANARRVRGAGKNGVSDNASVDFLGFRYRHSSVSSGIMELRQWQSLAWCGSTSLYIMGTLGKHRDRSGIDASRKAFAFMAEHEELYRGAVSAAEVLLVDKPLMGREDLEVSGLTEILTECHIPFDEEALAALDEGKLSRYRAVILPDAASLSDAQAAMFDAYVENGGTLVATGKTGLTDERRRPRKEEAVKAFGLGALAEIRKGLRSSIFALREEDAGAFPASSEKGLGYIVPGEETAVFEGGDAEGFLELVPEQKAGPPEVCYPTERSEIPGAFRNRYGKGTAVYIPFPAGTFYRSEGYENTSVFMKDVLVNLAGIRQVGKSLSPMCEVSVTRAENRTVIHLINCSGSCGSRFFEPVPMHDLTLEYPVPAGAKVYACRGGACTAQGDVIRLDVLNTCEVIVIEEPEA